MRRLSIAMVIVLLTVVALFIYNGLNRDWKAPDYGETGRPAGTTPIDTLRILTYNIAKVSAFKSGLRFRPAADVRRHLDSIAALLIESGAHLVFLTEINHDCDPVPVNQVRYLAERGGYHAYAFGANYSWGLPFFKIRSGNALLSRLPLRADRVVQLAGETPFYAPTNNRRMLWCRVRINEQWWPAAVLRNDSFHRENNLRQARQIMAMLDRQPAILAGDFNANPREPSIRELTASGRFSGALDGPATYPADKPREAIDLILAPAMWPLVGHRVIRSGLSDHLPALSAFLTAH